MNVRQILGALLLAVALPVHAEAARTVVEINNMAFGPAPAHLTVGDIIEWKNNDMFRHTATARTGTFDLDLQPGARAEVTLKKPGILNIYCRYHPTMTMRLTVANAPPKAAHRRRTPKRRSAR
jgi:plastocyanin